METIKHAWQIEGKRKRRMQLLRIVVKKASLYIQETELLSNDPFQNLSKV